MLMVITILMLIRLNKKLSRIGKPILDSLNFKNKKLKYFNIYNFM